MPLPHPWLAGPDGGWFDNIMHNEPCERESVLASHMAKAVALALALAGLHGAIAGESQLVFVARVAATVTTVWSGNIWTRMRHLSMRALQTEQVHACDVIRSDRQQNLNLRAIAIYIQVRDQSHIMPQPEVGGDIGGKLTVSVPVCPA